MDLIQYFTNSDVEDIANILQCLVNRVPILILGEDEAEIEDIINDLTSYISFRQVVVYYTDFVDPEEYQQLIDNEEQDYETSRNIYICYPFSISKFIDSIKSYKSWIIGCCNDEKNNGIAYNLGEKLNKKIGTYLKIKINPKSLSTEVLGKSPVRVSNDLEKIMYHNTINRTEIAVEKMRRVIEKRIKKTNLDEDFLEDLLNFSIEERDLKENLLKREIKDYYEASKRAFSVLNRIHNLVQFGFTTKISSKTLFSTIAYEEIDMGRILSFINAEWNIKFNEFFENTKISKFMDKMESLWG